MIKSHHITEYSGKNKFLLNIRDYYKKRGYLSEKQIEFFKKTLDREYSDMITIDQIYQYEGENEFIHNLKKFHSENGFLSPQQIDKARKNFAKMAETLESLSQESFSDYEFPDGI